MYESGPIDYFVGAQRGGLIRFYDSWYQPIFISVGDKTLAGVILRD